MPCRKWVVSLFLALACVMPPSALAGRVYVENGNVYFSSEHQPEVMLTSSGKDRGPVLSPDERLVAFVRQSDQPIPLAWEEVLDGIPHERFLDQLWITDTATRRERLLVEGRESENPHEVIAQINEQSLTLSPDSERVCFITWVWMTSGAVHCVNVDGSNDRFVAPGNSITIVPEGAYKGYLMIRQHRYFVGSGSYDWLWLFDPGGKEIGPLGEELTDDQHYVLLQ